MVRNSIFLFFLLFIFAKGFSATYQIPPSITWIKQKNSLAPGSQEVSYNVLYVNAQPGDRFELQTGIREPLRIDSIMGDSLNPILFINAPAGRTIVAQAKGGYFGIVFNYCRYIKLSGQGNSEHRYGIWVKDIPNGSGIAINNFSSNVEVENIEVSNIYSSGIVCKTDPSCENRNQYTQFVMFDIKLHDNYVHHIGNEGFYIGNTGYNDGKGREVVCLKNDISYILPHKIIGVRVYNNIVDSTGWDAIQVSATRNFEIYNNRISHDSHANYTNQQSGIMVGQPSIGNVYNNSIKDGNGIAIQCLGVGVNIYNNLIIRPCNVPEWLRTLTAAIYINDKVCRDTTVPRLPYSVTFNTVIITQVYTVDKDTREFAPQGINLNAVKYISGNCIENNLIVVDPGNDYGEYRVVNDTFNTQAIPKVSGIPRFISCNANTLQGCNFLSNDIAAPEFANWERDNFHLTYLSKAINAVNTKTNVPAKDLEGKPRPAGTAPDFGCYEFCK